MSPTEGKGQTKKAGGPSRTEIQTAKPDKKPFDKKKWRENKYNNKVKGKKFNLIKVFVNTFKRVSSNHPRIPVL